jgi:hypothetical protein
MMKKTVPCGTEVLAPYIGTGVLVDIPGSPPSITGRVVLTCGHCAGFDSDGRKDPPTEPIERIDTPGGYWAETKTYVSITPETTRSPDWLPLVNTLEDHDSCGYRVSQIYMPAQSVAFADVAILVVENSVKDESGEPLRGLPLLSRLWVPPEFGPLLREGKALVLGYGMTGYKETQLNYVQFGRLADTVHCGLLRERQEAIRILGWNTKKVIDISTDASFSDSDMNIRGVGGNVGSSWSKAGSGFSGSLVLFKPEGSDEISCIGIYSGPAFCRTEIFPGVEGTPLEIIEKLFDYVREAETNLMISGKTPV